MAFKDKLNQTVDKLKTQAASLAEVAQTGVATGSQRLESYQRKRQADALLLELGGLLYLQSSGRGTPEAESRIAWLTDELRRFEAAYGAIQVTPAVPDAGTSGSYLPGGVGPASPTAASGPATTAPPGPIPSPPAPPSPVGSPVGSPVSSGQVSNPLPAPGGAGAIPTGSYASETGEEAPSS